MGDGPRLRDTLHGVEHPRALLLRGLLLYQKLILSFAMKKRNGPFDFEYITPPILPGDRPQSGHLDSSPALRETRRRRTKRTE